MSYLYHTSVKKKELAYKSGYNNKRKNHVTLLMITDEAKSCYYFAAKNLSELYSLGVVKK